MMPGSDAVQPRTRQLAVLGGILAAYALVLFALWWRVFLQGKLCAWDCLLEYWPDLQFQVASIHHHELPTWCPWSLGGYAFLADPQTGFYSPVNWICIACGLLAGSGPWLIQLKVLLGMLACLCGMHALAWRRTRCHAAAAVAALTYLVGSPLIVHKNGAFLWPLLYLPWAVLALGWFHERPSARRAAALAAAVWLCGSAGHPQSFFYDLVILACYGAYLVMTSPGPRGALAELRRLAPGLAIAAAASGLLLAVIYIPAWRAVGTSQRAVRGLGYVLGGGMPIGELRELFVPAVDTNWQIDIYMGPLALVGAAWALIAAQRGRSRRETVFWIAVGVLGIELALGAAGLLPVFARYVPGFGLFRIAYRHKVIFAFPAALLAGDGVAAALATRDRRRLVAMAGAGGAWLAAGLLIHPSACWLLSAATLAAALAAGRLGGAGTPARRVTRRLAIAAIPLLVFLDLWSAAAGKLAILGVAPDAHAEAAVLGQLPGIADQWRYHVDDPQPGVGGTLPYHVAYSHEVRELSGYSNPIASRRYLSVEAAAKLHPALLAHFGVRYELGGRLRPAGATPLAGVRGFEAHDVAPLARVYPAAERLAPGDVLARLVATPPSRLGAALVEADAPPQLPASSFAPVDAQLVSYARHRIELSADAPAPGVLVLDEMWAPGWTATVNGRPAPVFRANDLLRGVIVPAGASRVVFEFAPRGYDALLAGFVAALAVLVLAAAGRWRWLDRGPPAPA